MTIWSPNLEHYQGPAYLAIAAALAADIHAGRLPNGTRLPTHRELADVLGVTVGTVTRAYAEAQRRNLISGEVGRGTFVAAPVRAETPFTRPAPLEPGLIDLSMNRAIHGLSGADLADALRRLTDSQDLGPLLDYAPDPGMPAHRETVAAWLASRGLPATPEQIALTTGAQNGITSVLSALTHPQDAVVTEALEYPGMKATARLLHLRLEGVELDGEGLLPDALERAIRSSGARVLYCVPTLQNPTTGVLSAGRRAAIVEVCRRHDVTIVEDNVYGFLVPDAPQAFATLAPERTYYLDSTSKLMGGGLRMGIVLAPPGQPLQQAALRVATQVRAASGFVTTLTAELACRWYADGTAARLVATQRDEVQRRQGMLRSLFDPLPISAHPFAPMVWLPLPDPWRADDFVFQARSRGVAVTPGSVFAVRRDAPANAVRICLGGSTEPSLMQGLALLADLLRQEPAAGVSGE